MRLTRQALIGGARGVALLIVFAFLTPAVISQKPTENEALDRTRQAVRRYLSEAALVLGDEECDQKASVNLVDGGTGWVMEQPRGRRRWHAEIAVVPTPDLAAAGYPWTEFRDVVVVDGRPVADRQERLSQLFLKRSVLPFEQARAIATLSARFNLGDARTLNTPSMPLLILHPVNQHRFAFSSQGSDTMSGVQAMKVGFREVSSPTLIKTETTGDCPASGTFWIAVATGDVLRADLQCGYSNQSSNRIEVRYRPDPRLRLYLPVEMSEGPGDTVVGTGVTWTEGKCRYGNYRRFETGAKLILPPKLP